jgi:hypothetical protein
VLLARLEPSQEEEEELQGLNQTDPKAIFQKTDKI